MIRLGFALAATASLFAYASASAQTVATPAAAAAATTPGYTPMVFPGWGFDPAQLDRSAKPGDDFFAYVNGKWAATDVIQPQYPASGVSLNLQLGAEQAVRSIVEEMAAGRHASGSLEQKVGDSYRAFVDTAAIEAAGMAPAKPYLSRIAAADSRVKLAELFAEPGIPSPLQTYVTIDSLTPTRNALYVGTGGLGLPDRDYYLVDSERNLVLRAKYKEYVAFLLGKAGYADPKTSAEGVYAFERKLAELAWDRAISRDPNLTTNRLTRAEFLAMAGGFPLDRMLVASGLGEVDGLFGQEVPPTAAKIAKLGLTPEQLAKLGGGMPALFALLNSEPIPVIQAWTVAQFLNSQASVLPREIDDASFAFYGTTLSGRKTQRERWQRGLSAVQGQMGEAIGKLYVERNFPASSKAAMQELVGNLRLALAGNLKDLAWMTPATRIEAKKKLDAFGVKIGYPDKFETYDDMAIKPGAALDNNIAAADWGIKDQLRDLAKPVDKGKWLMTPQTVNAYYMPPANEIVFPAAILQPPFFNAKADPAVNYGAIGAVIGHEIGHGFDDQGSKYDATGALRDWWTPTDRKTFDALTAKLAAQYDAFCPLDEGKTCLSGKLTLGENIGDLGGISMAYQAYKLSLKGKPAPVIDGLTGDQRFFIAFAQAWRTKMREEMARQRITTDPHSPAEARVNVVLSNFDPWYKAFAVKPGDKLYLAPKDRVRIW